MRSVEIEQNSFFLENELTFFWAFLGSSGDALVAAIAL